MLMEAMRLSLLDHEEHQRKEAEEQKKQTAAQGAAEPIGDSTSPGPGPSNLDVNTPNQASSQLSSSPSSSAPASSRPSSAPHFPRESASSSRNSPSISRSSTPPPANGGRPSLTSRSPNDRQRQGSNPPPFSTMAAALSAASTASAFLGGGTATSQSISDVGGDDASHLDGGRIVPTITVEAHPPSLSTTFDQSTEQPLSTQLAEAFRDLDGQASYAPLPSSPLSSEGLPSLEDATTTATRVEPQRSG